MCSFARIFFLFTVISLPAFAQNTLPLFPCYGGKPTANGCPAVPNAPVDFKAIVTKDDYYDVYVESVCINRPDNWWHKKLVHVEVTVKIGTTVNQTVPVYAERTGSQCHIGIANYPLLTSIPANNNRLTLASHVYRSKEQDGMQQILGFMVGQQKSTVLNTYAAAAVPYLTAVGDVASQVYKAFASQSENFQDFKDMDLVPAAPVPTRFDLKDEYIVVYAGNQNLQDSDVYLDTSTNLHLVKDDSVVAEDRSTWIVFRVQKRQHRLDYPQRPWYTDWELLVRQVKTRDADAAAVKKRISTNNTLLNADADYTNGDKDFYSDIFTKTQEEMLKYLANPNATAAEYQKAIDGASVTPEVTGVNSDGKVVTATNGDKPVVGQPPTFKKDDGRFWRLDKLIPEMLPKTIVPLQFLQNLRTLNQSAMPH
jgi:hypothetical protein